MLCYHIKQTKFYVAVGLYSRRSQKTSKWAKKIKEPLGLPSHATFLLSPHFEIICDIWLNRHMETCKSGYLQSVPHDTISLEKLEGFQFWEVIMEGSVTIPSLSKYKKINYHLKMVFCSCLLMLLLLLLKTHLYIPKTQDNCCEITNIVRKMIWNYETWQTLALTLQWEQTNPLMFSTTPKTGIFVLWQKVSSLLTSLTATP